jgi:hypothetical protein
VTEMHFYNASEMAKAGFVSSVTIAYLAPMTGQDVVELAAAIAAFENHKPTESQRF